MDSSITFVESASSPAVQPDVTVIPNPSSDPRVVAFGLVQAGVASGLPIPSSVDIANVDMPLNHGSMTLFMGYNAADAVSRWAAFLRLPAPSITQAFEHENRHIQVFESETWNYSATGHRVTVKTYIKVPAPAATDGGVTA